MRFSASSLNRLRSNQTTRWSPWAYIIGTCILFYVFVGKSSSQANRTVTHASSTEERKALVVDPKSLVTCPAVGSPYRLACIQSYGFFQTVHEDDWKREQEHARTQQQHDPPSHSEPTTWRERWIPSIYYMDHFQPTFTCPHSRRVGGLLDGGKWVCDLYRLRDLVAARRTANEQRPCLIYSIGSNGQFEFEEALVNVLGKDTCEIHVFDFDNYDKPELQENNIHFHTWGLTSSAQSGLRLGKHELLSFQDTQDRLGHTGRAIDLFKIDCEGVRNEISCLLELFLEFLTRVCFVLAV